jgi:hypothetical protein
MAVEEIADCLDLVVIELLGFRESFCGRCGPSQADGSGGRDVTSRRNTLRIVVRF